VIDLDQYYQITISSNKNESEKSTLQDQRKNQSNPHNQRKKERDKEEDGTEQKESHPYKGQFVDFSG
jgi:hypothetical protein